MERASGRGGGWKKLKVGQTQNSKLWIVLVPAFDTSATYYQLSKEHYYVRSRVVTLRNSDH